MDGRRLTVIQTLPALEAGGVERGTLEVGAALVERGHRSIVVAAGGRLASRLVAEGSEHVAWPVGGKSPFVLRFVPRLRRLLRETRADVVHARSRVPAWLAWQAWRGMDPATRPRFVTTCHGLHSVSRYSAIMARGERVIAVSRTAERYLLEHYAGVAGDRVVVIPRGIDPAEFPRGHVPPAAWLEAWRREQPELDGRPVLCLPGRLTRRKGHEDLLELAARLRDRGTDAAALVVGGEDPRRRGYARALRREAARRGLGGVRFLGHRADVREIMAVSDVVLSLSRKPESFGRTVLEALSLGRPVVGYDHGGVGEILAALSPAGRVPVGRVDAVADRVGSFLDRPPEIAPNEVFTRRRMLDAVLALYEEIVADG